MQNLELWLLRINGQIIGPLRTGEVVDRILEKQITGIDEASLPCSSWRYVRDIELFMGALERSRKGNKKDGEQSSSQSSTALNATSTDFLTANSDKTEELSAILADDRTDPVRVRKASIERALGNSKTNSGAEANSRSTPVVIYSLVTAFVLATGLAYIFKDQIPILSHLSNMSLDHYVEAKMSWKSGDFKSSLGHIRALKQQSKEISEFKLPHAALIMLVEKRPKKARKLLENETSSAAAWKNLMGLTHFYEGQTDEAEKYFLSSLQADANYIPALLNLGLIYRSKRRWSESKAFFESAYSKGQDPDQAAFLVAEVWARELLAEGQTRSLRNVLMFLNNHLLIASSYQIELHFLRLWLEVLLGEASSENLEELLHTDPYLTQLRRANPYVMSLNKSRYKVICNDLNRYTRKSAKWSAVFNLCLIHSGNPQQALGRLRADMAKFGAKPNLLALESLALEFLGKDSEAGIALGKAIASNSLRTEMLPVFMQAHFCEKKGDFKCSGKFWRVIMDGSPGSATAYTGLARAYLELGDRNRSLGYYNKASALGGNLRPLLELKGSIQQN